IGSGNVGSAIARAAARTGHSVTVTATDPSHAQKLADDVGATVASSNADAVRDAELVVLAVPYGALPDVAREIAPVVAGKPVVDVSNPMKPDYSGLATGERSAAEDLQELLPDAHVVKAFNTVFASMQDSAKVDGTQLDGLYAGDDARAKEQVAQLLDEIGYRPIDAGGLYAARALEQMAYLNISLNGRNSWPWQSAWKLVGPTG
ncbi:MAG: NADPH-dependent F420 reductase, partial [Frankia sp.]|nr:NADPH-dependent F420 reductase [Frankia sp.]